MGALPEQQGVNSQEGVSHWATGEGWQAPPYISTQKGIALIRRPPSE